MSGSRSVGDRQAQLTLAIGALLVSASSVLIDLAGATPGTASVYRCLLALPPLIALAWYERRRGGSLRGREVFFATLAGAFFAGDMLLWTQAIFEVGAGLSTVLVNVQVVLVPLLAWIADREGVTARYLSWVPVLLAGVVLTSGVAGGGAAGTKPLAGTVHATLAAVCYSVFLFLLRRGGRQGSPIQNYCVVIAAACVVALVGGRLWHGVDLAPGWRVIGWLTGVALAGTVLGWLLVATSSPQLPSHVGAVLLMLTPVGALALGALILGERPTPLQLLGCVLILAGSYFATQRVRLGSFASRVSGHRRAVTAQQSRGR
jgi:drug/metabolite transporter (DMT)-like permease